MERFAQPIRRWEFRRLQSAGQLAAKTIKDLKLKLNVNRTWLVLGCCFLAVGLVGCGPSRPSTLPVKGIVTMDGKPVAQAGVHFAPDAKGRPSEGVTDENGQFVLRCFDKTDGALPGTHHVTIIKMRVTGVTPNSAGLESGGPTTDVHEEWITPKRYADPATSGLTAEVTSGMAPLEFKLTSAGGKTPAPNSK